VAAPDRRVRTGYDSVAGLKAARRNNVSSLAVGVHQQRQVRTAVGVVFEMFDPCRHAVLVALELDQPIMLAMTAATMTRSNAAVVVTPAGTAFLGYQAGHRPTLVQSIVLHTDHKAASGRRRLGFLECHNLIPAVRPRRR